MDGLEASPLTRRPTVATPITKRTLLTLGAATVAVALGTSAQAGDCPAVVPGDPSDIGSWELLPYVSEVMVVHAAVMHTGKVLLFSGELEAGLPHLSGVWDPATGDFLVQNFGTDDLFCGGHAQMADGRILINGGADSPGQGIVGTNIYDPVTESWSKVADMNSGRWYPTTVTLGDGRIITFSGWDGSWTEVEPVEIYDPVADEWTQLPPTADRFLEIYPSLHLLPDGKLLYSGTRWNCCEGWFDAPPSALFDPATSTWSNLGSHIVSDRSEGHAVLVPELDPGTAAWKIMVAGGYANNFQQDTAEIIDLSETTPTWQSLPNMNSPRNNANSVILPTGNILFSSGIEGFKWNENRIDSLHAEQYDVQTGQWKELARMNLPAQYHSIGVLLPDGRVLKAGGHDGPGMNIHDMELYSPPYLFRGSRPTITSAPSSVGYGETFSIQTPDAADITRVSMVRLSSITHHTNTDQRFLPLAFKATGGLSLTATAPANGNVAPPGYYMLFILNECDSPSVASMVRLDGGVQLCTEDLTGDGAVTTTDLLAMLGVWGQAGHPADFDGSGFVDTPDLIMLFAAWGPC